jgi:hypothetical protein
MTDGIIWGDLSSNLGWEKSAFFSQVLGFSPSIEL